MLANSSTLSWEYPNNPGMSCNTYGPKDSANFLSFLKEIRASPFLAKSALLTAATAIQPFLDPDQNYVRDFSDQHFLLLALHRTNSSTQMTDVSAFAKYLDYIELMNYDIWGPWMPSAGPNSPLNDTCVVDPTDHQIGAAVSAVAGWNAAGFPLDQLVLGVASYGHSYSVLPQDAYLNGQSGELNVYPAFNLTYQPWGDAWDGDGVDVCGVYEAASGDWDFWGLIVNGFLDTNGKAAPGIDYTFNTCSQTVRQTTHSNAMLLSDSLSSL